jgi:flagellar P-ring protein precursor FlgI
MTTLRTTLRFALPLLVAFVLAAPAARAQSPARVGDLTLHPGNVPRRLVGYGIVTGLDGSGDRSFGTTGSATPSVRSVVNLLRRFNVEVPPEQLRMRDVAAVVVTAEVSPYLRAGGRFEVQVSALGDATSLRGGVLWITPLVSDPDEPPVATAQGNLYLTADDGARSMFAKRANSGRVPQGGVLEVDPESIPPAVPRLLLKQPDLPTASRIASALNLAFGEGTARVDDPGSLTLVPKGSTPEAAMGFFAAVDTVAVVAQGPARIVIDGREGTLVSGGDVRLGPALITHHGITLAIGGAAAAPTGALADSSAREGLVRVNARASVQDVAAGLHAAGVRAQDMAAIFEALQAAGALRAEVVIR